MRTSRKLTHVISAIFAILAMSVAAMAADPGVMIGNVPTGTATDPHPSTALIEIGSDMKAGSILAYTWYTSSANNSSVVDTRINITNTHPTASVVVHFFFVSSTNSCSVADMKTELTQNQTYSFLASDTDPETSGYLLVVAEDEVGLPIAWNYLIGDAFVKTANYSVNLAAISYAARWTFNTQGVSGTPAPGTNYTTPTTTVNFGGAVGTFASYDALGRSFAVDNVPSRAGGDRVLLINAGIRGDYVSTAGGGTTSFFGVLYDDNEAGLSFSQSYGCSAFKELSNGEPRTTPRFETWVPAGRTGWIRMYTTNSTEVGTAMSMIVYNTGWGSTPSNSFHGAHNLHVLTRPSSQQVATFPVFPYELQTN